MNGCYWLYYAASTKRAEALCFSLIRGEVLSPPSSFGLKHDPRGPQAGMGSHKDASLPRSLGCANAHQVRYQPKVAMFSYYAQIPSLRKDHGMSQGPEAGQQVLMLSSPAHAVRLSR